MRVVHAGCGVNALSGLQKSCQFNILQDHVGLISVAHQQFCVCHHSLIWLT
ncbi:putative phosphopantetheinyltransferase component of enterobactin synthase multienzyme complex [Escherichia coli MS 200-1]|nr:putative phosphopantetheinyltransferase component of enterobactin synthase multienzyme complex [Escherichia coli MS 200-1]